MGFRSKRAVADLGPTGLNQEEIFAELPREAPLTLLECMVHVEECQVVSIDVGEPHLGLVRSFLGLRGSYEALRH